MKRFSVKALLGCMFVMLFLANVSFSEVVTVRFAGQSGTDQNLYEDLIAKFITPKLPNVKVAYEPLQGDYQQVFVQALSAGTAADIFYMDIYWAQNIIKNGSVEPLDSYLATSKVLKTGDFIKSLIDAFTMNGKVYGIAKDFNTLALYYNKDMFDKAKVAYPNDKDTWDTLEAKLVALKKALPDVAGFALAPDYARFGAFAYSTGFQNFTKDGKSNLKDAGFVRAFKWYTGLKAKGLGIMPSEVGQGWTGGAFGAEKTATALEGAWLLGYLHDSAPNMNYGVTTLPKDPVTKKRGNFIFTVALGINAKSKVKKEAFQVLEILTSPEVQQYVLENGLAIPSRKALANNAYFKKQDRAAQANLTVFKGATDGNVYPYFFGIYSGDWMAPINTALSEVMSGQKTVDASLDNAQKQLDLKMAELNKQSK